MNTNGAAKYIRGSKSFLDRAATARQRAQKEAERAREQGKPEPEVDPKKIGPKFRWVGSRREYDQPFLDDYIRETTVEPRHSTAVQLETQSKF